MKKSEDASDYIVCEVINTAPWNHVMLYHFMDYATERYENLDRLAEIVTTEPNGLFTSETRV